MSSGGSAVTAGASGTNFLNPPPGLTNRAVTKMSRFRFVAPSPDDLNRLGSYAGAMAQSNNDQGPDIVPPQSDLLTAAALGERVAKLASRMKD